MLSFQFTGVQGQLTEDALLTSGMAGQTVKLEFDGFWEELSKTVVFVCGGVCQTVQVPQEDIHMTGISVTIPAEALVGGHRLYVGVYGHMDNGAYATPTVMVKGPRVLHGADPTQSPDGGNLPVWASLQEQIGRLEELNTAAKESLVAAINEILAMAPEAGAAGKDGVDGKDGEDGATFTPHMSEYGVLSWTNDKGLTNPRSQNLTGPDGEKGDKGDKGDPGEAGPAGADGKSAYDYAVEGGYGGSEAEFAAKLAAEFPTTLPNPQRLTFTGAVSGSYDGSAAVSINIPTVAAGESTGGTAAMTLINTVELTEAANAIELGNDSIDFSRYEQIQIRGTLNADSANTAQTYYMLYKNESFADLNNKFLDGSAGTGNPDFKTLKTAAIPRWSLSLKKEFGMIRVEMSPCENSAGNASSYQTMTIVQAYIHTGGYTVRNWDGNFPGRLILTTAAQDSWNFGAGTKLEIYAR